LLPRHALFFKTSENDFDYYNNGILPSEWMTQQNASYQNTGFTQHFLIFLPGIILLVSSPGTNGTQGIFRPL